MHEVTLDEINTNNNKTKEEKFTRDDMLPTYDNFKVSSNLLLVHEVPSSPDKISDYKATRENYSV